MNFTCETDDLRAALIAVSPHIHRSKDFTQFHRLRLTIDPENVSVTATNQSTTALAIASLVDSADGVAGSIDLHPQHVKEILALFKTGRKSSDEPDQLLRIEATDEHVIVTDVSGLWPGKSVTVPRFPGEDQFPDIPALLSKLLILGAGRTSQLVVSGGELALFSRASVAYGQPLVVDAPSSPNGAMIVACGESFLGLLRQLRQDPDETRQLQDWRDAWMRRIGMEQETS